MPEQYTPGLYCDPRTASIHAKQISALLGQQASTLLLIQKQDCSWRKPFPLCRGDGGCGIRPAEGGCILASEFCIEPAVVQDHEAETVRFEQSRACPSSYCCLRQEDCSANNRCRKSCGEKPAGGYPRDSRSCRSQK